MNRPTEPHGNGRDVYWCWIVNEPCFLTFPNGNLSCPLCNWSEVNGTGFPSEGFLKLHTFVTHVAKPRTQGSTG